MVAGSHDEQRIARAVLDIQGAAFEQGVAAARGNHDAAAGHLRDGLLAVDLILRLINGERVSDRDPTAQP